MFAAHRQRLEAAAAAHRPVAIDYFSPARNLLTRRPIQPYWIETLSAATATCAPNACSPAASSSSASTASRQSRREWGNRRIREWAIGD
jgi:hypothetical protein